MSEKQERFVEEYCRDCNGAAAARRAGYSEDTARQKAYELLNSEEIAAAINVRLKKLTMTAEEAIRHTTDIASSRLTDFMITVPIQAYEQTEQYVTILIAHLKEEIRSIEAFIGRNKLNKEQRKEFDDKIITLQKKILEYEIEVERYGDDVTRLAPGKPVVTYIVQLDLVALAQAKEGNRIKTFKETKDGVQVEMYAADSALDKILQYHGKLVQKFEHKMAGLDNLTTEEVDNLRRIQERLSGEQ